ncbi:MAG: hypothetical protein U1F68_01935 [Gammaproteobacteria bacterium]
MADTYGIELLHPKRETQPLAPDLDLLIESSRGSWVSNPAYCSTGWGGEWAGCGRRTTCTISILRGIDQGGAGADGRLGRSRLSRLMGDRQPQNSLPKRGQWNERMLETVLSNFITVAHEKTRPRVAPPTFRTRGFQHGVVRSLGSMA